MKSLNILIILFFAYNSMLSQNITKEFFLKHDAKIDSLTKIDFLSYKYKYLDENFKITIPKEVFEKAVVEYKFFPERIRKYRDSLGVVLMAEFKDFDAARISELRICYEWKRVAYHTWMNEKEVLDLAQKLDIKMPYRLQELFLNNDPKVAAEIQNLRKTLFAQLGKEELMTMPAKQLLLFAFSNNPEIIEMRKNHHKSPKK